MNRLYSFFGLIFLAVASIACNDKQSAAVEVILPEQEREVSEE